MQCGMERQCMKQEGTDSGVTDKRALLSSIRPRVCHQYIYCFGAFGALFVAAAYTV